MPEETEGTPAPAPAPAPPAARTADDIRREPAVALTVERLGDAVVDAKEFAGEITLIVDRTRIREAAAAFWEDGYHYLVDLTAVDYSEYPGWSGERFAVAYHIYSHGKNERVRLKVFANDGVSVESVSGVWKTANWFEREVFDMFGITFEGHPNLERILMWEGFNGHPLRKDFPIRGIDTGAAIYPEVFPEGGGPKPGSTGKDHKDVHLFEGEWTAVGRWPAARLPKKGEQLPPAPELAGVVAETAKPTDEAPWHDPDLALNQRMDMAKGRELKDKLFAAMAQTDCTACGWDCEGYASAIATGETKDLTLCVPGEAETEAMLKTLVGEGK